MVTFGSLGGLRRWEASFAGRCRSPVLVGLSGVGHARRASFLLGLGGAALPAPHGELLARLLEEAPRHLDVLEGGPAHTVERFVAWLEHERLHGFLSPRAHLTATLVLAVSDREVWTWHVSPHGVALGTLDAMEYRSTDRRYPALRALGEMPERETAFGRIALLDRLSAAGRLGAPETYESLRLPLGAGEVVACFDRTALPFGPLPTESTPLGSLWARDAGWKHGLGAAHVVLVSGAEVGELQLPRGWTLREVPFAPET